MNNIPIFTSEHGIASLTLKQIPSKGQAYITLGSSMEPELLLKDCADFCKSAGATRVFASGFPGLEQYPLYTKVISMQALRENLTGDIGELWPLLPENSEKWRRIYNEKMENVDNAAYLDFFDMKAYLRQGDCYFIHRGDSLLGIGKASRGSIDVVASLTPGGGDCIVRTLASLLHEDTVHVEVASTNEKAQDLYKRLGFLPAAEKESWYEIL